MSDRDLIAALKENRLHIDCSHMELVQNKEDKPRTYIGRGYIYQDEEGIISFKLYVDTTLNTSQGDEPDLYLRSGRPGTLFEEARYYHLSAVSYHGDHWTVPRLLHSVDWYPEQRILVTGALYTITCARDVEHEASAHHFQIHFFTNLDLPFTDYARTSITTEGEVTMSLLAAKFESESGSVDIREAAGELLIGVSSQSAFPTNFHMRIIEAITFVSAKQTLWRVTHTVDGDKEILQLSSPRPQSKTKLRGPLYLATLTDRRMFWRLFAKYLEFSVRSAPEQGWHPCFVHIHNAIEASANSLDAWAVGLCVAVEGLANMIEVKDDASEKEKCCKIIEHVHAFLKSTSWLNQKVGNRARGLLNQLHQPRVIDRLSVLIEEGRFSKDLVKAWQRLRPRASHGAVIDMETVDKEVIETMLYDIGCVTTLLYQITFYLMGYDEGYTDYSKNGWPTGSVRTEVSGRPDGMST